jgi:hypothetical protein
LPTITATTRSLGVASRRGIISQRTRLGGNPSVHILGVDPVAGDVAQVGVAMLRSSILGW